jgi:hypothetical protein
VELLVEVVGKLVRAVDVVRPGRNHLGAQAANDVEQILDLGTEPGYCVRHPTIVRPPETLST